MKETRGIYSSIFCDIELFGGILISFFVSSKGNLGVFGYSKEGAFATNEYSQVKALSRKIHKLGGIESNFVSSLFDSTINNMYDFYFIKEEILKVVNMGVSFGYEVICLLPFCFLEIGGVVGSDIQPLNTNRLLLDFNKGYLRQVMAGDDFAETANKCFDFCEKRTIFMARKYLYSEMYKENFLDIFHDIIKTKYSLSTNNTI